MRLLLLSVIRPSIEYGSKVWEGNKSLVSRATPTSKESGSGQIPISVSCRTRQEILGVLIECLSGFNGCDVKTHVW